MDGRGEVRLLLEVVIALALLGLFVAASYTFIYSHDLGNGYFSQFYATDLATSAELVNAPYGDVILRYDNLKPTALAFWLRNGRVAVGRPLPDGTEPPGAEARFYGHAEDYPSGPLTLHSPTYLSLRKVGGSFAISDVETLLRECPRPAIVLDPQRVVVSLALEGFTEDDAADIRTVFAEALDGYGMALVPSPADANVRIGLVRIAGRPEEVTAAAQTEEDASFTCLLRTQLETLANTRYAGEDRPQGSAQGIVDVTISLTLSSESRITGRQIGTALALALAEYT